MYNIYHRTLNIFNNSNRRIKIYDNKDGVEGIGVESGNQDHRQLFEYNYDRSRTHHVPECGEVIISQYISGKEQKKQEIERLKEKLKNTHIGHLDPDVDFTGTPLIGANSYRISQYEWKIKAIKEEIKKLEESLKPSSKDIRIIEVSKEFNDIMLDDFGLTKEDFSPNDQKSTCIYKESYIKKPKLLIKRKDNYI